MSVLSFIAEEKSKCCQGRQVAESVYSSSSRVCLVKKRGMGSSAALGSSHSLGKSGERSVTQRVLSAKMHRVRSLQNQLADAHYHLNELSNENKVLRAMQKKQEIALQRYENSSAELPKVLNSHTEEVRTLQARCKQLRQQHKQTVDKLKEREMELQQLRDEHKHLLDLSKDRSLLEREKLQAFVVELTEKVTKQNETISSLQRRLTLEAKNFKHQLKAEISKHKDTRNDLDLAINNADKLTSIIEMKERLLNNGNGKRGSIHVSKFSSNTVTSPGKTKSVRTAVYAEKDESSSDDQLSKLCENSRYISSALSKDEHNKSDGEVRSRSALANHSRTASSKSITPTIINTRKNSSNEEHLLDIAKNVQESMSTMMSFQEEITLKSPNDDMTEKLAAMKAELLNKVKHEDAPSRKSSGVKKVAVDVLIEEHAEVHKSRAQSRRNSGFSFKSGLSDEVPDTKKPLPEKQESWTPLEVFPAENKKTSSQSLDTYCKNIMQDIENSSRVIDQHMKEYTSSRFDSDHLVQQLESLDKMSDFVSSDNLAKLPTETLEELNNNFKTLGNMGDAKPIPRKRSIAGVKTSAAQRSSNAFGDASMTNQDLLNDLLGK